MLTGTPGWEFAVQGNIETTAFFGYDLAIADDGTVYTHSSFSGTSDFDPSGAVQTLSATPDAAPNCCDTGDGVVARYTADRELLWARRFGGGGREFSRDIEVDSAGNAYIVGTYYAATTADFGSTSLPASTGGFDIYAAKVDANGNFIWARSWGGSGTDWANEIDLAADGSLAIGVSFVDTIDFDAGPGTAVLTSFGGADAAILRLDSAGNFLSVKQLGGPADDSIHSLTHDFMGNTYAVGAFQSTVDFGGSAGALTATSSSSGFDGFLWKLDPSDESIWVRQAASSSSVLNQRVAADGAGNIYWSTGFQASLDLGPTTPVLTAAGTTDLAIMRWSANGALIWTQRFSGSNHISARDHIVTSNGQILIPGWFTGTADFDPGSGVTSRTSNGGEDAFLLTLNADGSYASFSQAGGTLDDRAYAVGTDGTGNTYLSGNFRQSAIMPSGQTLTGSTYNDFYLVKLAPALATKFFVVDGAADNTHEFDSLGNRTDVYSLATSSGNTSPRGTASNPAGNRVWVVDANKKVYVYDDSGNLQGSWAANGLTNPQGITTQGTDVWIVDAATNRVYRFAGGAARMSGTANATSNFKLNGQNSNPTDLVTDGTSLWVVNDAATDKVFKYSISGTLLGSWTLDSRNTRPTGITINPANVSSIYILDNARDQVFEYLGAATRTSGSHVGNTILGIGNGQLDLQGLADPPIVDPPVVASSQVSAQLGQTEELIVPTRRRAVRFIS